MTIERKRRAWALGLAFVVIAAGLVMLARHYDLRSWMERVVTAVRDAGPWPFFGAMALLPTIGFPLSAFTLVAGPVFGPTMGIGAVVLCGIAAIAFNVAFSYWLAARALHPAAAWVVQRLGYEMPEMPRRSAWFAITILRTVPVTPFCVQSLLLGLARVPFGPYMLVSVIVPSAYATAMMLMGDALIRGDRWAIAGATALFLVVGIVLHVMRKRLGGLAPFRRKNEGR